MEFSSLISDQGVWVKISAKWSGMTSAIAKIVDACKAIETINNILESSPLDMGGVIAFPHTVYKAEELYHIFQVLFHFVDGIHYEIGELVDNPFMQKIQGLIEEVYELDPKDFRTQRDFLIFSCGNSLEEVLVEMISTEELEESYTTMIKNLNEDFIEEDLLDAFQVADYWKEQYGLAGEIREIHSRYVKSYKEEWENLSPEGKLAVLNEYAVEIGVVLDKRSWITRVVDHEIIVEVNWNIKDPRAEGYQTAYAYTYSRSRDGLIYLNVDAMTDTSKYDLEFLLNVITHETRHQYQGQAKYDANTFEIPTIITDTWWAEENTNYYTRPWEIDARAFAAITSSY